MNKEGLQKLLLLVEQQPLEPPARSPAPQHSPAILHPIPSPSRHQQQQQQQQHQHQQQQQQQQQQQTSTLARARSPSEETGDPMSEMIETQALKLAEEGNFTEGAVGSERGSSFLYQYVMSKQKCWQLSNQFVFMLSLIMHEHCTV